MDFSLAIFDRSKVTSIRKITEDDFNKYSYYIKVLEKFLLDHQLLSIVEFNYAELTTKMADFVVEYKQQPKTGFEIFGTLFLDLNRLVLNFLSSVRTYLDHTETRLKREYGVDSVEVVAFKKATAFAYDNYFSYRFLYKLRNYAQHCGLPAGALEVPRVS